jgi:hypothetical protein
MYNNVKNGFRFYISGLEYLSTLPPIATHNALMVILSQNQQIHKNINKLVLT